MSDDMRIACVMMQRNERDLLAPWMEYHARLCGYENIHIFDNGSDDPETLRIVDHYRARGVDIDRSFATRADFNRKGQIIARKIHALDQSCEFFFPLDCDEFLACRNGDQFSIEPDRIAAVLEPVRGDPRVLAIAGALDNNPAHPDWYRFEPAQRKCFFAAGACRSLDIGFHNGRAVKTDETVRTEIVYFHLHNRPFTAQKYFSAQKLEGRIASFTAADMEEYQDRRLPGFHLIPALLDDRADHDARHAARPPLHLPRLSALLQSLGTPLAMAGSYPEVDLPTRAKTRGKRPRGCIDAAVVVGHMLTITGWSLDNAGQPATPRGVRIGGVAIDAVAVTPVARPDVSRAEHVEALMSGFSLEVSLSSIPPEWLGQGGLDVVVDSTSGAKAWLPLPSDRVLQVAAAMAAVAAASAVADDAG